jgi:hypothetical protein
MTSSPCPGKKDHNRTNPDTVSHDVKATSLTLCGIRLPRFMLLFGNHGVIHPTPEWRAPPSPAEMALLKAAAACGAAAQAPDAVGLD